ncbi:hypothetical protein [Amycolatopsis rubida]|nr:hypothetical protein [Amycolatopsis rubida]
MRTRGVASEFEQMRTNRVEPVARFRRTLSSRVASSASAFSGP